jgi:hypothetical protein
MKNKIFFPVIIGLLLAVTSFAQRDFAITYGYDANGNRISKEVIVLGKKSSPLPDSTQQEPEYIFHLEEKVLSTAESEGSLVLKAYPNPTKGIVLLTINSQTATVFRLYDMNGKKIREGRFVRTGQINLLGEKPGIYFLKLKLANTQKTLKILKK